MEQYETKKIDFDMRDTVSGLYRQYGFNDSAHAFNSLYIWAKDMKITTHVNEDLYAARLCDCGPNTWFFPVGSAEHKKEFIADRLQAKDLTLRYMTEEDVRFLSENFPDEFLVSPADSDSEYVCDRDTIENLPGKTLNRKKRYVKKLLKEHTFEIKKLTEETIPDVRYILGIWRRNKDYDPDCNDLGALDAMIDHLSELELSGIVIYMDDVPCSVMAGYLLSDDTIDCCLQKSAINTHGLQYYVRQQFSYTQPKEIQFYNFEEDLGLEGLRQAKEFMHPCGMIKMYTGKQK